MLNCKAERAQQYIVNQIGRISNATNQWPPNQGVRSRRGSGERYPYSVQKACGEKYPLLAILQERVSLAGKQRSRAPAPENILDVCNVVNEFCQTVDGGAELVCRLNLWRMELFKYMKVGQAAVERCRHQAPLGTPRHQSDKFLPVFPYARQVKCPFMSFVIVQVKNVPMNYAARYKDTLVPCRFSNNSLHPLSPFRIQVNRRAYRYKIPLAPYASFQLLLTLVLYPLNYRCCLCFSGSSGLLFVGRWVEDTPLRSAIEQRKRKAGYRGPMKRRIAYSKLKKDPVTDIRSTGTELWVSG